VKSNTIIKRRKSAHSISKLSYLEVVVKLPEEDVVLHGGYALLWSMIDGTRTVKQLAEDLSHWLSEEDIKTMLRNLIQRGLASTAAQ
jgi:hypothetical protein